MQEGITIRAVLQSNRACVSKSETLSESSFRMFNWSTSLQTSFPDRFFSCRFTTLGSFQVLLSYNIESKEIWCVWWTEKDNSSRLDSHEISSVCSWSREAGSWWCWWTFRPSEPPPPGQLFISANSVVHKISWTTNSRISMNSAVYIHAHQMIYPDEADEPLTFNFPLTPKFTINE